MSDTTSGIVRPLRAKPAAGEARSAAPAASPHRRRLAPGRRVPYARLLGPLLLLGVWSAASGAGVLDPRLLSAPWTVAVTAGNLIAEGQLQANLLASLQRTTLGLALGITSGSVLAVFAGLSRVGEALVDGTMQVARAIPPLASVPLLILWLGIDETMKVVVIASLVAILVYINTRAALVSIDSRYVELAEILGLSRWQFVRKVVIPGGLPGFFIGLRLGVTVSWLGLVVVEQINATSGIGYMMFQAQQYAQSDVVVVGLLVFGILGFASDSLVRAVERRALSWRRTLAD